MKTPTALRTAAALLLALAASACEQIQPRDAVNAPPGAAPERPAIGLWEAASTGNIASLAAHRAVGTNLNALQPDLGVTALVAATAYGQEAAVAWLLGNGADVNARTGDGNTTLHAAAFMGNVNIAGKLLAAGIDVSTSNDDGQTVWQTLATDWQTTRAVANLYDLTLDRQTVEAGRTAIGELLAPYLEDLGTQNIWLAVAAGNADSVRSQIGQGEDVNQRNDNGATLLTVAAIYDHADVAALLLDAGADVNARNQQNGATALHAAAFLGRADTTEVLLEAGADAGLTSENGGTALAAAQLDWATTEYVAGTLQVPAGEEASVMAGKAAVVKLLRAKLGQ